jgi:hypothetical protein
MKARTQAESRGCGNRRGSAFHQAATRNAAGTIWHGMPFPVEREGDGNVGTLTL